VGISAIHVFFHVTAFTVAAAAVAAAVAVAVAVLVTTASADNSNRRGCGHTCRKDWQWWLLWLQMTGQWQKTACSQSQHVIDASGLARPKAGH